MKEIKAFVGHSFTEDDAPLVRKFLDHFDHIAQLDPMFSWSHAEAATPQELPAKVLAQVEGKNVFIGICTKKERVQKNFASNILSFLGLALTSAMIWKTSDWIIQEIGLAKGRGLDLVLLVEEGVRKPGGLQGDVEYIEFERSAPEKAFNKIMEMITALSPKTARTFSASADVQVSLRGEPKNHELQQDALVPTADWKRDDFERAMLRSLMKSDEKAAADISAAYLETRTASEGDNRATWLAHAAWLRVVISENGDLAELKKLSDQNPASSGVKEYLAWAYEEFQDYDSAADTLLSAERVEQRADIKRRLKATAAVYLMKAGEKDRAESILMEMRSSAAASSDAERELLGALRRLAEWKKSDVDILPLLERLAELAPEDLEVRFNLAFKHSEVGNNDLALLHYLKIPFQMRSGIAWNNLGVAYDHFVMPAKAVSAFLQAEGKGETLAMSNIARKRLSVGFIDRAKEICQKAITIEDYHNNVTHVLAELRDVGDQEEAKLSEVREKAGPKAKFYQQMGRAVAQPEPTSLSSLWQGPNGSLELTSVQGEVRIFGSYDLSNALANALAGVSESTTSRWFVDYTGKLRGRLIEGTVVRRKEGERPKNLLEIAAKEKQILMVIAPELNEIQVVEEPQSAAPTWYTLKAKA